MKKKFKNYLKELVNSAMTDDNDSLEFSDDSAMFKLEDQWLKDSEKLNSHTDWSKCPYCDGKKVGSCRCRGPHTVNLLLKGHGNHCENGHRYSSYGVVDKEGNTLMYNMLKVSEDKKNDNS